MTIVVANSLPLLLILMFSSLAAAAQSTRPQALDLPGEAPFLVPETERPKINLVTMGLRISSDLDVKALDSNQAQQEDAVASIQPHLGWRFFRPRLDWAVDYRPRFSKSPSSSASDSLSQLLDSGFQLKLTKRLRVIVHESFLKSGNPFDQLQAADAAGGSAAHAGPGATAPVTAAEVTTEQARGDVVYALNGHSTVGVGGEFFSEKYTSGIESPNPALQNSSSAIGHGYYTRQITRHQWTGLDYRMQKTIFNSGQTWSVVHSLVYTHTITLSPRLAVSFFVGPERSVTRKLTGTFVPLSSGFAGDQAAWHGSGGATGRWIGMRTSMTVLVYRKVSDGGILGAVELAKSSAELTRQLGRQWSASLLASYDDSKALAGPGALSYVSAAGWLTHKLGPNLSLQFQYWREHLSGESFLPAAFLKDHNRLSVSLVYERGYPLGR